MLTITPNQCSQSSFRTFIVVLIVSVGIIFPNLWTAVSTVDCEISMLSDSLEDDTDEKSLEQFTSPPEYLPLIDDFSAGVAADPKNGFLHHAGSIRAPPVYTAHS